MRRNFNPTFFEYLIAGAAFLLVVMFSYPFYNQDHFLLIIFIPLALIVGLLAFLLLTKKVRKRKKILQDDFPEKWKKLLEGNVRFYQQLDPGQKKDFEGEIKLFLGEKRIIGIDTEIDDLDRLLVASSATIPIFSFHNWEYTQLDEILISCFQH